MLARWSIVGLVWASGKGSIWAVKETIWLWSWAALILSPKQKNKKKKRRK